MNCYKSIMLSSVFVLILLFSVLSVTAADIDDYNNTLSSDTGNIHLQEDVNDFNVDDGKLQSDLNSDDNDEISVESESDVSHDGLLGVSESNTINNNENQQNNPADFNRQSFVDAIVNSTVKKIVQYPGNVFEITFDNLTTIKILRVNVNDFNSFKNALNFVSGESKQSVPVDILLVDFQENSYIKMSKIDAKYMRTCDSYGQIIFRGRGSTVDGCSLGINFLEVKNNVKVTVEDLILTRFGTSIVCDGGSCYCKNLIFKGNNRAIYNKGLCNCVNCSFVENRESCGCAAYNEEFSQSVFIKCFFNAKIGNCMFNNDGKNIRTCKGAICVVIESDYKIPSHQKFDREHGIVNDTYYIRDECQIDSLYQLIKDIGHRQFLTISLEKNKVYEVNHFPNVSYRVFFQTIEKFNIENLKILGNGATIRLTGPNGDEDEFIRIPQACSCFIENVTFESFNTAIKNDGGALFLNNVKFNPDKKTFSYCNRESKSSIVNNGGYVVMDNCIMITDNMGHKHKKGGAIFNDEGVFKCYNSKFYIRCWVDEGGAIYNNKGYLFVSNCTFDSEDGYHYGSSKNGAAIFNHYASMTIKNCKFIVCVSTNHGGAIYNDFSKMEMSGCHFYDCFVFKKDYEVVYNYGDDLDYHIKDSWLSKSNGEYKNIDHGKDCKPSTAKRWGMRVGEIVACVVVCVACTVLQVPEAAAFAIGLIAGGLLAAGEEYLEEKYLDHEVNVWNIVVMGLIAGAFDAAADVLGTFLGKLLVRPAMDPVTHVVGLTAKQELGLTVLGFVIETISEVASEVIPRFDFRNLDSAMEVVGDKVINSGNCWKCLDGVTTNLQFFKEKTISNHALVSKEIRNEFDQLLISDKLTKKSLYKFSDKIENIINSEVDLILEIENYMPFNKEPLFLANALNQLSEMGDELMSLDISENLIHDSFSSTLNPFKTITTKLIAVIDNVKTEMSHLENHMNVIYENGEITAVVT